MKTRGYSVPRAWNPFQDFEREIGRLFDSLEPAQSVRVPRLFPPVNLYENGPEYLLTAEVPGMEPGSLDVSLVGDTLTLRGERKRPEGISQESYRRQERPFGKWSRSVTLPDRVDSSKVSANYTHGVLTVTLPKTEEGKPRQIAVTTTP